MALQEGQELREDVDRDVLAHERILVAGPVDDQQFVPVAPAPAPSGG